MSNVLLSIDCSNRWTCLGLAVAGASGVSVGERNNDLGRAQAAKLPVLVEEMLAVRGLNVHDLTAIAVTVGPGYFTGIRIGIAYAAALAFSLNIKVIPLSTLEAVLRSCPKWNEGLKVSLVAASRELAFSSAWLNGKLVMDEKERSYDGLCGDLKTFSMHPELWAVRDVRLFASVPNAKVNLIQNPSGAAMATLALGRSSEMLKPDELKARYLREPGLGRSL